MTVTSNETETVTLDDLVNAADSSVADTVAMLNQQVVANVEAANSLAAQISAAAEDNRGALVVDLRNKPGYDWSDEAERIQAFENKLADLKNALDARINEYLAANADTSFDVNAARDSYKDHVNKIKTTATFYTEVFGLPKDLVEAAIPSVTKVRGTRSSSGGSQEGAPKPRLSALRYRKVGDSEWSNFSTTRKNAAGEDVESVTFTGLSQSLGIDTDNLREAVAEFGDWKSWPAGGIEFSVSGKDGTYTIQAFSKVK